MPEGRRGIPARCHRTPRWRATAPATRDGPGRCRGGGTSRRWRYRTRRGSRRPVAAPSRGAGLAGRATTTAASPGGSRRQMAPQEKDDQGKAMNEPFRQARGRVWAAPICIGGTGFGRDGVVRLVHSHWPGEKVGRSGWVLPREGEFVNTNNCKLSEESTAPLRWRRAHRHRSAATAVFQLGRYAQRAKGVASRPSSGRKRVRLCDTTR